MCCSKLQLILVPVLSLPQKGGRVWPLPKVKMTPYYGKFQGHFMKFNPLFYAKTRTKWYLKMPLFLRLQGHFRKITLIFAFQGHIRINDIHWTSLLDWTIPISWICNLKQKLHKYSSMNKVFQVSNMLYRLQILILFNLYPAQFCLNHLNFTSTEHQKPSK